MTGRLIVPALVAQEILEGPPADPARQWIQGTGAGLVKNDAPFPPSILARKLGAGESAVLAHSLNESGCEAIIDDLAAQTGGDRAGHSVSRDLGRHSRREAERLDRFRLRVI